MGDDAGSREVYWVYGTRSGADNVFVDEVRDLLSRVGRSHRLIAFSKPGPDDRREHDYDVEGRIDANAVVSLGVPPDAHFYLCGPSAFMASARSSLIAAGYADDAISSELFGTTEALRPGIAATATVPPHLPASVATEGPVVSFVRSGISLHWDPRHASLLELAEACDVPVRWSCRSGVCHTCETAMVDGSVTYDPDPLQPPAEGRILLCCARPSENVELDI